MGWDSGNEDLTVRLLLLVALLNIWKILHNKAHCDISSDDIKKRENAIICGADLKLYSAVTQMMLCIYTTQDDKNNTIFYDELTL